MTAGQVVSSRQCVKQETAERRGRRGGKSRNLVIVIFAPGSLGLPGSSESVITHNCSDLDDNLPP